MRINSIHLTGIRSHKDTTLTLERITTISGLNHAGKSGVEQSLELALARRNETTGPGGQGQTDLLRFGQDQGVIDLGIDLNGVPVELRASLTKKSGLNVTLRNPEDKNWSPIVLENDLRDDRDVLSCLCNNRFLIGLKPVDTKPGAVSQKSVISSVVLPTNHEWPETIKADLHEQRIGAPWNEAPLLIIDHCYDLAFKMRTAVNRSIKDWRAPTDSGKYDGPPIEDVRSLLSVRQNERTDAAVEQQRLQNEIQRAKDAKANHERRAADAQHKIEAEKLERARVAEASLSKAKVKEYEKEAAGAKKAKELDDAIAARKVEIAQVEKQIEKLDELAAFSECPTCRQALTDEVFGTIVDPIKKKRDDLGEAQNTDLHMRKALGDPAGAQKKLDAHKAVDEDLERIDKRIKDLERTAATANQEAHAINPDELPKPDSLNEKIADLDTRIQKGTGFLEQAARADALKLDAQKALDAKAALDAELARLERLVTYFGPKGVKAELIATHIGGFEEKINAVLSKWGYEFSLSIEPWSFEVRRQGSKYACQLHMLSRSEKLRFANAFSVALAIVSGWNFVVLDDSETIIGEDRRKLNRMLLESEFDQAIVLAAEVHDSVPEVPGTAFIQFHEVVEEGISTTYATVLASTPMEKVSANPPREPHSVPA